MAGGLIALLDDVAALAKLAAASVDDVAAAAGRAGTKAAGVVIDDTAVTPGYVVGLSPDRELPIIWKICLGSIRNKLLILLPAALALSAFAPWAVTPLLMVGGAYLAFEAMEKIWNAVAGVHHETEVLDITDPVALEARQVSGAVRTDFILSAEIMAIALSELPSLNFWTQAAVLAVVAIAITAGVYGAVALLVKLDDIGLHLMAKANAGARKLGNGLVHAMPYLLSALGKIGTAAMLWVGGGIFLHGLHEYHLTPAPDWVDSASQAAATAGGGTAAWLVEAIGGAMIGAIVGGIIVAVMHLIPSKKPDASLPA
jgi:predicted DNA repair protein MutK